MRNFGIKKRQLSFPTRSDQCRTGPGDVHRTANQHNRNKGLHNIAVIPASIRSSDRFHAAVLQFPLPLVAAVNGPAAGGGMSLTLMADIRLGRNDRSWVDKALAAKGVSIG